MENNTDNNFSLLMITLFKGIFYREQNEKLWDYLIASHGAVKDYLSVLHLELYLDEAEGYAFLKNQAESEEGETSYPKLIARRALSFEVSLLLALLRKSLVEFDATQSDTRFILSHSQLIDLMKVHFNESSNQAKVIDKIDSCINKVIELGFLQKLKSEQNEPHFEVKRILKAFIDAQWLLQFDQWLENCLNAKGD